MNNNNCNNNLIYNEYTYNTKKIFIITIGTMVQLITLDIKILK